MIDDKALDAALQLLSPQDRAKAAAALAADPELRRAVPAVDTVRSLTTLVQALDRAAARKRS